MQKRHVVLVWFHRLVMPDGLHLRMWINNAVTARSHLGEHRGFTDNRRNYPTNVQL